tara:strand:+ start:233 stop:1018 length:786 start_codon:yes stop_codon:yes gene_type:complete
MINFEKWHGNGNDFAIINSIENKIKLNKSFIRKTADRNKGIGFDQLIHIGLPTKHDYDFFIRFYNSDGSEAGMCLNGIRCAARYIWNNNLFPLRQIEIQTKRKNLKCSPKNKNNVSVLIDSPIEMQTPDLEHNTIKKVLGDDFFLSHIGNNHLCVKKKSIDRVNLEELYKNLENVLKKYECNLSIFKKNKGLIQIRTYENGTGETLSCGSAALCVAAKFLVDNKNSLKISSIGGELEFSFHEDVILMSGPTNFIYKGNVNE